MVQKNYQPGKSIKVLEEPVAVYTPRNYYYLSHAAISKKYIKNVLQLSRLSLTELIGILPISIDSYKRKSNFMPSVTEKVLEIEEVYKKGLSAFGESFYQWMNSTNIAMGNIVPKTLLGNSFGIRILLDEICRIEHGIFA